MRDLTAEILEVKKRSSEGHGFISFEVKRLIRDWLETNQESGCVPDFYIIRAVTLLEVFTRRQLTELIGHSDDHTQRAVALSKHFKMDFTIVHKIQGHAITLGDLIAYSVPVNSFTDIISHFETVLGKKLSPLLAGSVDRWLAKSQGKAEPIIKDYDAMAASLSTLFEIRHIICHELPTEPVYLKGDISRYLQNALEFSESFEEILTTEKYGNIPLTQSEMNADAYERLTRKEEQLKQVVDRIRRGVAKGDSGFIATDGQAPAETFLNRFDAAQEKWLAYREGHSEFIAHLNQGGSIWPLIFANEKERLTDARIVDLESWMNEQSKMLTIFTEDDEDVMKEGTPNGS